MSGEGGCRTVRSLAEVPAAAWDRLVGDDAFHLSYEWLRAVETLAEGRYRPLYLLAGGPSGGIAAAAAAYELENPGHYGLYNPFDVLGGAGAALERASLFPALLCGSASGYAGGVLVDPALPATERDRALTALIAAIERHAERNDFRAVAFPYLPMVEAARLRRLLDAGYVGLVAAAECRLALTGSTFDDYLARLSRSRRSSVRREVGRFERSGIRVRVCRLHECAGALPALVANVQRRHGHRAGPGRFVANVQAYDRWLGSRSRVFLAERDGAAVGFTLFFAWRGRYYGRLAGFDYERLRGEGCYFNLAYYLPVREALREGVTEISLGVESYEAKVARGCDLRPLYWYLRPAGGSGDSLRAAVAEQSGARERAFGVLTARLGRRWHGASDGGP